MNICVFASGNGTCLQAILDEINQGKMPGISISFVLVNKATCGAVEKAKKANIPFFFIDPFDVSGHKKSSESYDRNIHELCLKYEISLIVLVGWMRILSPWFVHKWPKKILNIHPSLLPKYPGMDLSVHQAVLRNYEKESGMTIHYVDEGVDTGEIILQKKVSVDEKDTVKTLRNKVQGLEKIWYPEVIRMLSNKREE